MWSKQSRFSTKANYKLIKGITSLTSNISCSKVEPASTESVVYNHCHRVLTTVLQNWIRRQVVPGDDGAWPRTLELSSNSGQKYLPYTTERRYLWGTCQQKFARLHSKIRKILFGQITSISYLLCTTLGKRSYGTYRILGSRHLTLQQSCYPNLQCKISQRQRRMAR